MIPATFLILWLLAGLFNKLRKRVSQISFQQCFPGQADSLDSKSQFLLGGHLSMTFSFQFLIVTLSPCPLGSRAGNSPGYFTIPCELPTPFENSLYIKSFLNYFDLLVLG